MLREGKHVRKAIHQASKRASMEMHTIPQTPICKLPFENRECVPCQATSSLSSSLVLDSPFYTFLGPQIKTD